MWIQLRRVGRLFGHALIALGATQLGLAVPAEIALPARTPKPKQSKETERCPGGGVALLLLDEADLDLVHLRIELGDR